MPQVLQTYNTDYRIIVQNEGTITLDTTGCENDQSGTVVITGNLEVQGDTTTVSSTNLELTDNIILLSEGTTTAGLPSSQDTSGIEIDRGTLPNAKWIYDESVEWQLGTLNGIGSFYAAQGQDKIPITTPGINAQGDLYIDTGAGAISVANTPDYETRVFNYDSTFSVVEPDGNGFIVKNNDYIPNAKAVKDYVDYNFRERASRRIAEGNTRVETIDETHALLDIVDIDTATDTARIRTTGPHGFFADDTVNISEVSANGDPLENINQAGLTVLRVINKNIFEIEVDLTGADADNYVSNSGTVQKANTQETRVEIEVEGKTISNFYENRLEIGDLEFRDTEITTTVSDSDLVLKTPGTGSVVVDDSLLITTTPYDDDVNMTPLAPAEGVKLYAGEPGTGAVGVYYVNNNNRNDELTSKNRSLLFSMLF